MTFYCYRKTDGSANTGGWHIKGRRWTHELKHIRHQGASSAAAVQVQDNLASYPAPGVVPRSWAYGPAWANRLDITQGDLKLMNVDSETEGYHQDLNFRHRH